MSPSNQERNPLFCNRKDSLQLSIQLFPFHLQQHFNINQIRSVYIIDYAEFGAKYLIPRACPTLHQTFLKYKFWCQITLLVLEHLQPFAKSVIKNTFDETEGKFWAPLFHQTRMVVPNPWTSKLFNFIRSNQHQSYHQIFQHSKANEAFNLTSYWNEMKFLTKDWRCVKVYKV